MEKLSYNSIFLSFINSICFYALLVVDKVGTHDEDELFVIAKWI